MAVWAQKDSRGDATRESAGAEEGHAVSQKEGEKEKKRKEEIGRDRRGNDEHVESSFFLPLSLSLSSHLHLLPSSLFHPSSHRFHLANTFSYYYFSFFVSLTHSSPHSGQGAGAGTHSTGAPGAEDNHRLQEGGQGGANCKKGGEEKKGKEKRKVRKEEKEM